MSDPSGSPTDSRSHDPTFTTSHSLSSSTALSIALSPKSSIQTATVESIYSSSSYQSLERLIGLKEVKERVDQLIMNVIVHQQENGGGAGAAVESFLLFSGNSGTGKHSAAKIVASILFQLGLVSTPEVYTESIIELLGPSDSGEDRKRFIEELLIQTAQKVLLLNISSTTTPITATTSTTTTTTTTPSPSSSTSTFAPIGSPQAHWGRFAALEELATQLSLSSSRRFVILVGHPAELRTLGSPASTPNLFTLFPLSSVPNSPHFASLSLEAPSLPSSSSYFPFPDFTDDQLLLLLSQKCNERSVTLTQATKMAVVSMLSEDRDTLSSFSNAKEIETLLVEAIARKSARLATLTPTERQRSDSSSLEEDDLLPNRSASSSSSSSPGGEKEFLFSPNIAM
eukprot:TRINITY_DN1121_c0_g1_i1.p1 TRINITY_DN1121_c0_g1~~TRINITY_DN1121_c0_g1_i1.p1  ORF type:complete len:399 (+),score=107.80 TRINITY_DN1121_c0_g1_i1:180-1376(+)